MASTQDNNTQTRSQTMRPRAPELVWRDQPEVDTTTEPAEPAPTTVREIPTSKPTARLLPPVKDPFAEPPEQPERDSWGEHEVDGMTMAFFDAAERASSRIEVDAEGESTGKPILVSGQSPEEKRRKQMMRGIVSGLLSIAAALSLGVAVKQTVTTNNAIEYQEQAKASLSPLAQAPSSQRTEESSANAVVKAQTNEANVNSPTQAAAPSDTKSVETDSAAKVNSPEPVAQPQPEKEAQRAASEGSQATEKAEAQIDPAKAKQLARQALGQLEAGNFKGAIEKAELAIEADPTDANAYMYLGTALMEQGKRKESKEVFAKCAETATKGPKAECLRFR